MSDSRTISTVICELNPLHFGHEIALQAAKQINAPAQTPLICVMSGNFVQRGEPAILDKWTRTKLALQSGANLVIELPLPWACAGAERFASGAVYLTHALGLPANLIFGSEDGDLKSLQKTAAFLLSDTYQKEISSMMLSRTPKHSAQHHEIFGSTDTTIIERSAKKQEKFRSVNTNSDTLQEISDKLAFPTAVPNNKLPAQRCRKSYASLREEIVLKHLGANHQSLLQSPNSILGVEYCKAIQKMNANITPYPILRLGAGHDQNATNSELQSASTLRNLLLSGHSLLELVPSDTWHELSHLIDSGRAPCTIGRLERAILSKLRHMHLSDFQALPDVSEGLENRLMRATKTATSLDELFKQVKSKRYTHARIRRLVLSAFLGIPHQSTWEYPPYLRILGMDDFGAKTLKSCEPRLPVLIRSSEFRRQSSSIQKLYELECSADDQFALCSPKPQICGLGHRTPIVKI